MFVSQKWFGGMKRTQGCTTQNLRAGMHQKQNCQWIPMRISMSPISSLGASNWFQHQAIDGHRPANFLAPRAQGGQPSMSWTHQILPIWPTSQQIMGGHFGTTNSGIYGTHQNSIGPRMPVSFRVPRVDSKLDSLWKNHFEIQTNMCFS